MKKSTTLLLRNLFLLLPFLMFLGVAPAVLLGQTVEICNNGIDDDGDGFVDCYDPDCSGDTLCEGFFFGDPEPGCQDEPDPDGDFSLEAEWTGTVTIRPYNTVSVGDLDNDGIPEIVTWSSGAVNRVYVLNGLDGSLKYQVTNTPAINYLNSNIAIADVDLDGNGDLFLVSEQRPEGGTTPNPVANRRYLYRYEYNGGSGVTTSFDFVWKSPVRVGYDQYGDQMAPSLADFNGDGTPEIYLGNQIYNSLTGAQIASGGATNGQGRIRAGLGVLYNGASFPVAVDILPDGACANCAGLELVAGNQVYSVDVGSGTMTVEATAPAGLLDGYTSVADVDLDGDLDVVVSTFMGGTFKLYVWDPASGSTSIYDTGIAYSSGGRGIGRANIANFDSDPELEIGFTAIFKYYVLESNATLKWELATTDDSGRTGSTVFDFLGDGSSEVVYRDETNLRILDGNTGTTIASIFCGSATWHEYPVIADIDMDGQAEIVVGCGNVSRATNGTIKAFRNGVSGTPWVPARSVWNQHTYFTVNVNDNLSIPSNQQSYILEWPAAGSGTRPLNNFLNQATFLTFSGEPSFPAADVGANITSLECSGDTFTVFLELCNSGDNTFPNSAPVSFYDGNPATSTPTLLSTQPFGASVNVGECGTNSFIIPGFTGSVIYAVANDDGSLALPFDIASDFPVTSIGECEFENNIASIAASACVDAPIIPVASEWGLILLGLFLMCLGSVVMWKRRSLQVQ